MSDTTINLVATLVLAGCAVLSVIVLVGSTIWSIKATRRTTDSNKRNIRLQAISQALNEYGSVEMGRRITMLYDSFKCAKKRAETIASFDYLWETEDRSKVDSDVDEARRCVAWYFTKIFILYKEDALTVSDIKEDYLATAEMIENILLDKIERLDRPERRGNPVYTFFRNLYSNQNEGTQ